jgi:type I restriction enzyme S subunit
MISLEEAKKQAPWAETLPTGWRLGRLKSVASIRYGLGQPPAGLESGVAMIRATDVDAGTIRTEKLLRVDPLELPEGRNSYLKAGEIIVVRSGAYTGDSAIIPPDLEGAVAGYDMVVTASSSSSHFIAYCLLSRHVLDDQIHLLTLRAAQPHLNAQELGSVVLTLPPTRREQDMIAAHLDASSAAIDAAAAVKRRQLETLNALCKAIIQRAVTRGLSESVVLETTGNTWLKSIPRSWKLVCLKRIAEIQGGLTLGKQYEGLLIERPYLRVGNVQDGHLDLEDVSVIELPESVAAGVELRPDDVLMTEGGDLDKLGRGHLWNGEIAGCLHQNHIFAVRCFRHKLAPRFLSYVTAAKYGRDYFEATGKKTTNLACTNATKVGEFPIPLPSLEEQKAICDHLDKRLGEIKRIADAIEAQITILSAYRKSLIHECVTGQRRVTEVGLSQVKVHG